MSPALDDILDLLACPAPHHAPLRIEPIGEAVELVCTECGRRYPVRDGIPVLLLDEAHTGAAQGGLADDPALTGNQASGDQTSGGQASGDLTSGNGGNPG